MELINKCIIILAFILIISFLSTASFSYGSDNRNNSQNIQLSKAYQKYLDWWINVPVEVGSGEPITECISFVADYIYLMDPYGKKRIDATCEIPAGHSIFAPFLHGWCDTGNQGFYNASLQKLKDCLGPVNAGRYTLIGTLDGKNIINSRIELMQDTSWKILSDNSQPGALAIIDKLDEFFDVTLKNSSRYASSYENPDEFTISPKKYQAIGICLCGIIDSDLLAPGGQHVLSYHIGYEKSQSEIPTTDVTYTFKIK